MERVTVKKVDEVFMQVNCDDGLARDLYDFFSFTVPNAKFMPSYKNRFWDGKVRLFSLKTKKIYIGLLPYVDEFCRERGYDFGGIENVIGEKNQEKLGVQTTPWLEDRSVYEDELSDETLDKAFKRLEKNDQFIQKLFDIFPGKVYTLEKDFEFEPYPNKYEYNGNWKLPYEFKMLGENNA